jgi:hypothetical protein
MRLDSGERSRLRKSHPCGGTDWLILRAGIDFRIQCQTCGHQIWMTRVKLEKQIKQIIKYAGQNQDAAEGGIP